MTLFLFTIIVLTFLILFLVYFSYKAKRRLSISDNKFVVSKWDELEKDQNIKNAIIEADKILDFVLKKKGYSGSLGQKLITAEALFTNINSVWDAHKLRNRLVHELDINLSSGNAKSALQKFKNALKDLGVNF